MPKCSSLSITDICYLRSQKLASNWPYGVALTRWYPTMCLIHSSDLVIGCRKSIIWFDSGRKNNNCQRKYRLTYSQKIELPRYKRFLAPFNHILFCHTSFTAVGSHRYIVDLQSLSMSLRNLEPFTNVDIRQLTIIWSKHIRHIYFTIILDAFRLCLFESNHALFSSLLYSKLLFNGQFCDQRLFFITRGSLIRPMFSQFSVAAKLTNLLFSLFNMYVMENIWSSESSMENKT